MAVPIWKGMCIDTNTDCIYIQGPWQMLKDVSILAKSQGWRFLKQRGTAPVAFCPRKAVKNATGPTFWDVLCLWFWNLWVLMVENRYSQNLSDKKWCCLWPIDHVSHVWLPRFALCGQPQFYVLLFSPHSHLADPGMWLFNIAMENPL